MIKNTCYENIFPAKQVLIIYMREVNYKSKVILIYVFGFFFRIHNLLGIKIIMNFLL